MIRTYRGHIKLFYDAANIVKLEVRANTERKARQKLVEKARKLYPKARDMVSVEHCEIVERDGDT